MPPGAASGSYSLGAHPASQSPVHGALRLLKTQLNLAIGQREEDPERAWLEAVSVRERLETLAEDASGDTMLQADVDRFKGKLEQALKKLTRDVGDEVVAPLYSWVDLLRQRDRLELEVETARTRVMEARASRGAPPPPRVTTVDEAASALEACEGELQVWRGEPLPSPPPEALAVWAEAGGDALRHSMPTERQVVQARGIAAIAVIEEARSRPSAGGYAGLRLELVVLPTAGAAALLSSMFAFARQGAHIALSALAVFACGFFGAAVMASVQARRRTTSERQAAVDLVWFHTHFAEQVASLELEVGWLRAMVAALRARRAFDAHKGEGGQLDELSKWRPDLTEVVADVAKSSLIPPR